jgi:long-chain fatty acid transport protein
MKGAGVVFALLVATPAFADEYHYQGSPIGGRAAAMGGAFTGLANDGAAAYYNPAGLVLGTGTELSLSTSVYGIARDDVAGSQAAQPPAFLAFPATFVLVKTPFWVKDGDPSPRHRYGLAILITDFTKIARQGLTATNEELFKATDTTTYFGLSYAYRISDRLSVGSSAWLVSRSIVRFDQSSTIASGGGQFALDRRELEGSDSGLQLFLGALWRATDRLSFGLNLRTPSVDLGGTLTLTQFTKQPAESLQEQTTDKGVFTSQLPLSLAAGTALRLHRRLLVSADLSVHAPTGRYVSLQTPQMTESVDKDLVLNGAVGAEFMLSATVPLRLGFYTDRSSRPAGSAVVGLSALAPDYSVVTGSIGYETERTALVGGTAYQFGDDTAGGFTLTRSEIRWWVAASYRL